MDRINTYAPLDEVESADLNLWQDRTVGEKPTSEDNDFAGGAVGGEVRRWQSLSSFANATRFLLDTSIDWRDRLVSGSLRRVSSTTGVGRSADTTLNDPTSTSVSTCTFEDQYTGTGAVSNLTTGADVVNGSPPLNGVGVYRSCAVVIDDLGTSGDIYLYADPTSGELFLYNASGAAIEGMLKLHFSGQTGLRS